MYMYMYVYEYAYMCMHHLHHFHHHHHDATDIFLHMGLLSAPSNKCVSNGAAQRDLCGFLEYSICWHILDGLWLSGGLQGSVRGSFRLFGS